MPPPPAVIPVAEVATQVTEVANLLRTLSVQFAPSPAIDTIHKVLPEVSGTIQLELAATINTLQGQPTLSPLTWCGCIRNLRGGWCPRHAGWLSPGSAAGRR